MIIHFTGTPPAGFILPPTYELKEFSPEVPPFNIDALLVFPEEDPKDASVKTLQRSGRPVFRLASSKGSTIAPASAPENAELEDWLSRLSEMPRTNYQPIDCNFYDNFEAAIVQRRKIDLEYRTVDDATIIETIRLKDLKTDRTEEYVQLENNEWLRLDRIVSVDGEAAGASCRF
ncbi:MAG: hypothetical protein AB8H12_14055 [Lewinella sp.]